MTAFLVAVCAVLGLLVGSFLNVVIWRVPRDESVVHPRSRCPACGNQLRSIDNIPVLSWLFLRGRCHFCRAPIAARYPLVELATGVLFAAAAARFAAHPWPLPAFLVLIAGLVALSGIDIDHHRLPNKVLYPTLFAVVPLLVVAGAATHGWNHVLRAAVGGLIGFAILFLIHVVQPRGMGFGDVRLAGLIGVGLGWLSLGHVFVGLFLAFLTSAVIGIALIATGVKSRKDRIPFGPYLALGCILAVLWGEPLLRWYHPV
jgi:leader peptidase (prepilin peptidase)/N-methyltransferase